MTNKSQRHRLRLLIVGCVIVFQLFFYLEPDDGGAVDGWGSPQHAFRLSTLEINSPFSLGPQGLVLSDASSRTTGLKSLQNSFRGRIDAIPRGNVTEKSGQLAMAVAGPLEVWVDDDFSPNFCDGHTWGVDCFDTVHGGVGAVAAGGIIHVLAGNYSAASVGQSGKEPDAPCIILQDVTISGEGATTPVLQGDFASSWTEAFLVSSGTDGVVIEGLEIRGFTNGISVSNSSPTIRDNEFHDNLNSAVFMSTVRATQTQGVLERNTIHDENVGISLFVDAGSVGSPLIRNNILTSVGTGIDLSGLSGNTPKIYHNTIDGRFFDSLSGVRSSGAAPEVMYNIITNFDEYGIFAVESTPVIDYNDVWNNWSNYSGADPGQHDISEDPLYGSDLLQLGSPCINAIPLNAGDPVVDDLGGNPRPSGSGFDMGAFESPWGVPGSVIFVDRNAPGENGVHDGTSWLRAFTDLQSALAVANAPREIWVAAGIYVPGTSQADSFHMKPFVAVYGGFDGSETSRDQRDWKRNPTVLSGDVNGDDGSGFANRADNSFHVVTGGAKAILDGFIISGGSATGLSSGNMDVGGGLLNPQGSSLTVANCVFAENTAVRGGGMFNDMDSRATVFNCVFSGNSAQESGGGIHNSHFARVVIANCVFHGNSIDSIDRGGAVANDGDGYSVKIIHSTFVGNSTFNFAGGSALYNGLPQAASRDAHVYMENSIVWDNPSEGSSIVNEAQQLLEIGPTVALSVGYSDLESTVAGIENRNGAVTIDIGGNLSEDPLFLDGLNPAGSDGIFFTADDGFRLKGGSLCADAGRTNASTGSSPDSPARDILGTQRPQGAAVDTGAYEGAVYLQATPISIDFGRVKVGTSSPPQEIGLLNVGAAALSVQGMTLSNGASPLEFSIDPNGGSNPCGSTILTLPVEGGCTVTVTFTPSAGKVFSDVLSFASGNPQAPLAAVDLTGRGVIPRGALRVTLNPPAAVSAGAAWSIDGGQSWNDSGVTLSRLPAGEYTLSFMDVSGWISPESGPVTVSDGATTAVTGRYVRQTGSLVVTLRPAGAVSAGAAWSIDGGQTWNESGVTLSRLAVGEYTVSFRDVAGWTTPTSQTVTVTGGQLTTATGRYVRQTGSLLVVLKPLGALSAGAAWSIDGGRTWNNSGVTLSRLPVGEYTVSFRNVAGWTPPNSRLITIESGTATLVRAAYARETGSLRVTIVPPAAVEGGAQWRVDGGRWQNSGSIVTRLAAGEHTVSFKTLDGWNTPADRSVVVSAGEITEVRAQYVRELVADFSASPTAGRAPLEVVFTDSSTGVVRSWLWEFGDGETSADPNPTHTYAAAGSYTVRLTVQGPAGTDTRVRRRYITAIEPVSITLRLPGALTVDAPEKAYRLIGIPVVPDDPDIFRTLKDHFGGAYDPGVWRLYKYANGEWKSITRAGQDRIDYGKGWWIISSVPKNITLTGLPLAGDFGKSIGSGYQVIGCPFHDRNVSWDNVVNDEVNAGLGLGSVLYTWEGGPGYARASVMEPGKSYLVWVTTGGRLQIKRRYGAIASPSNAPGPRTPVHQPSPPPPPVDWSSRGAAAQAR